ncbi:alpha 1,3 fucosyltransferase [Salix suchowensis]|nr:alpha 1,3 fucosyltransferase [Salix suchowensis]
MGTTERTLGSDSCEEWLEKEDAVVYARDFDIDPILVTGDEKEWMTCGVGCQFGFNFSKSPDARFGFPQQDGTASVLRSMESTSYYAENNIAQARRTIEYIKNFKRFCGDAYTIGMPEIFLSATLDIGPSLAELLSFMRKKKLAQGSRDAPADAPEAQRLYIIYIKFACVIL